jgi:hypothetical protein
MPNSMVANAIAERMDFFIATTPDVISPPLILVVLVAAL